MQLRFVEGRDPLTRYLQAELALFEAESTPVTATVLVQTARASPLRVLGEEIAGS